MTPWLWFIGHGSCGVSHRLWLLDYESKAIHHGPLPLGDAAIEFWGYSQECDPHDSAWKVLHPKRWLLFSPSYNSVWLLYLKIKLWFSPIWFWVKSTPKVTPKSTISYYGLYFDFRKSKRWRPHPIRNLNFFKLFSLKILFILWK